MNNYLTFEDGHIEYWSIFSISKQKLIIFDSQKKALDHIKSANDSFPGGVGFHKELNGQSLLD